MLFAPPQTGKDTEVNEKIVKSLKKYQERRIMPAHELQTQMSEKYSEDGYNDEDNDSSPTKYVLINLISFRLKKQLIMRRCLDHNIIASFEY